MFNLYRSSNTIIFIFLYSSLLVGYFLGENSTGGAFVDFKLRARIIEDFNYDFKNTFLNYDKLDDRHSPIMVMLFSLLNSIGLNLGIIRLLFINILPLLIFISYKCFEVKFPDISKKIIFLLCCVFFISPILRSTAIWPDSRILGLLFFMISLFFFLKFKRKNKFKYCFYNNFFLIFASYISPNFSIFFIYFIYHYFNFYKFTYKFFSIFVINTIFSIPMFIYIFIMDVNFLTQPVNGDLTGPLSRLNLSNKIFIISTLVFFYLLPIIINLKIIKMVFNLFKIKSILITILIFLLFLPFFNYQINYTGGGIFFKLSYFIFENQFLFYLLVIFSLLIILIYFKLNINNILLFLTLIISNPQLTIYHKYYDPLLILLYFLVFEFKFDIKDYLNKKLILNIYIFYTIFLCLNFARIFF